MPGSRVVADGIGLHVVDEGAGPPLLLMAALGSNWFDLDPLAARLVTRGWRVLRYDRPGYGLSDPMPRERIPTLDDEVGRMSAVLDAAAVDAPVTVVGHSLASLYVEAFARVHPARTAAVVMLDGSYVLAPWRVLPTAFRVANAHRVIGAVRAVSAWACGRRRSRWRGGARWRSRLLPAPPEGFDDRQHYWGARVFGRSRMLLATLVENAAFPALNMRLRRLRRTRPMPAVPVVVVAAAGGPGPWRRFWLWKQGRFAAMLGGRLRAVAAGHFLVLEVPDAVAGILDDVRRSVG